MKYPLRTAAVFLLGVLLSVSVYVFFVARVLVVHMYASGADTRSRPVSALVERNNTRAQKSIDSLFLHADTTPDLFTFFEDASRTEGVTLRTEVVKTPQISRKKSVSNINPIDFMLAVEGNRSSVHAFIRSIESAPYVSELVNVVFTESSEKKTYEARLTLRVYMLP
jgi:hypothetical protein